MMIDTVIVGVVDAKALEEKQRSQKNNKRTINDKGQELPIMNFLMRLENSVSEDLYDYIVGQE